MVADVVAVKVPGKNEARVACKKFERKMQEGIAAMAPGAEFAAAGLNAFSNRSFYLERKRPETGRSS